MKRFGQADIGVAGYVLIAFVMLIIPVNENLLDVLYSMEMPLIRILARMERNGILLSSGKMESLKTEIDRRVSSLVDRIYSLAGHEFNINSTMQLSKVLFE